ncbi:MAG: MobA-related protein [Proteobacteria bacterium]|nr:MobA-related protein [Pseudomonadota bacterium]
MPVVAGEIVGILLAAGRGRRFGGDKLQHLLPDGLPLAVAAANHLRPACDRLIAVLRPGAEALGELLGAAGCETLVCADADLGMGHSLAAAIRATPDAAGWVVALADMPFIATASQQSVVAALRNGASLAATEFQGQRGHPVGFAGPWFAQLSQFTGDQGAKSILQAHRAQITLCAVDDSGVLRDVDTPDDLFGRSA